MTFEESAPERKLPEKTPEPSYSPMKLSSVVKEPELGHRRRVPDG